MCEAPGQQTSGWGSLTSQPTGQGKLQHCSTAALPRVAVLGRQCQPHTPTYQPGCWIGVRMGIPQLWRANKGSLLGA